MLELEEKCEMELELEEGVEGWRVLTDEKDRAGDERAKQDKVLGYDD